MPNQSTDLTPYLFLAAMIIIGGLVAFVADGMGRKIGKKRLSFFGLRPRYTATLITVAAGILIPILTIAAIYALSGEVREWIQKGRGAIQEARAKTEEVKKLDSSVKTLQGQKSNLDKQVSKLGDQTKLLNAKVAKQQGQLTLVQNNLTAAQSKYAAASQKIVGLSSSVQSKTKEIQFKQKEIASKAAELQQRRAELSRANQNLKRAGTDLNSVTKEQTRLVREVDDLEKQLNESKVGLTALQAQKAEFERQIAGYQQSVKTLQDSIQNYTDEIDRLSEEVNRRKGELQTNLQASRLRPLIFDTGEEVARLQLPPSLSPVAARNAYLDLLQRARTSALARKALVSPTSPAAGLYAREFNNRVLSIREQEDAIIRGITSQRSELVLIARSVLNAFEGEYVLLEFLAFRNKLVYTKDKLIIEKRIDGRKSDVEVFDQIQEFISVNVRAQALRDGIIPPSGRTGQLGIINKEEVLQLIREARSFNQLVRLQALARNDTNAGDQLELTFRVRL